MQNDDYKKREKANRYGILHLVDDKDFITFVTDLVQERPHKVKNDLIIAINRTKEKA